MAANMLSCKHCGRSFSRSDNLRRHIITIHQSDSQPQPQQVHPPQNGLPPQDPGQQGQLVPYVVPQSQITLQATPPYASSRAHAQLTFEHPFTMCIAGPTSCGKTTWLKNVLQHGLISPAPTRIIWCYREWQPLYTEMLQHIPNITFVHGIQIPEVDPSFTHLVVIDDLMIDASKDKDVSNMFTVGSHHKNMSIICLLQNLFYQGKENRTMSLNSHYLVLFKNPRDQLQVSCLARQMYPNNAGYFMEKFKKATSVPFGCLVVDLKQTTLEENRLKSGNVFDKQQVQTDTPPINHPTPATQTSAPQCQHYTPEVPSNPITNSDQLVQPPPKVRKYYDSQQPLLNSTPPQYYQPISSSIQPISSDIRPIDGQQPLLNPTPPQYYQPISSSVQPISSDLQVTPNLQWQSLSAMDQKSDNFSCVQCGDSFHTKHFLERHMDKGCGTDESDGDDDDNLAWGRLANAAYDELATLYGKRVLTLERQGMSEKDAKAQVEHELMPQYVKSLAKNYKILVKQIRSLDKNSYHREIMHLLTWYEEGCGYSFDKAIKITLRKKRRLLEEILADDSDTEDDEQSGEEEEEESS